MKPVPEPSTKSVRKTAPAASPPPVGDITAYDRTMDRDDALVHDALCALQAPCGITRVADLMTAAELRTQRGTAFNPMEVRRVVERLIDAQHVVRDAQNRVRAAQPHAGARLREMLRDPQRAAAWFDAWARLVNFDRAYGIGFQDTEQLAAAMRLVAFGGSDPARWERLRMTAFGSADLWQPALELALLQPFDAALFERIEPEMQMALAAEALRRVSGFAESATSALEDWLLDGCAQGSHPVPPLLRCRLAETLVFRGQFAAAHALLAPLDGAVVALATATLTLAEGDWALGVPRFEAALKLFASAAGRRKNLVSPSIGWLYVMALLASSDPAAWTKARKFVAAERTSKVFGDFWDVWLSAIDQRLGDAPRSPEPFALVRASRSAPPSWQPMQSLQYLHHLLLAAWLRVDVEKPAVLRAHADALALQFEQARMAWLALLTRRAAAALLNEPPLPADAGAAFFVGAAQDTWRVALAAIVALGGDAPAGPKARAAGSADRLIWVVDTDAHHRIASIEPWEQKAGVRGLGRPKAVSLGTLIKRKDLPAHDAAVLRAVQRDDYGSRLVIDAANAAPALVRHPSVAWRAAPTEPIDITEGLPALEIMTQGEHITFRLLDPVRNAALRREEAHDLDAPVRYQAVRARLRNTMLLADGPAKARLVRLTPAQLRVTELVSQGWKVPVAARAELDAALRVLSAHFAVASDAEAGHAVEASTLLRAELKPQATGLSVAVFAVPFGDFGPRLAPGAGRERVTTVHQGVTLSTQRQLGIERQALQGLLDAAEFLGDDAHEWFVDDPQLALAVVEALSGLRDTIVTEWPKGQPMRVRSVPDAAVKLTGRSKGDWLELDGALTLDNGEVLDLRRLLELARSSRGRYIALAEGDFLALGDALRQQLADLAALAQTHKGGARLSNVAAMAWAASGTSFELDGDAAWRTRALGWAAAQQRSAEVPAGLAADLRDYQLDGYRWLMRLADSGFGAVLADDMGLGKTVQTLAVLLQRAAGGPALVVAPTSVCGNWLLEVARFAPGLRVELYGDVLGTEGVDDEFTDAADPALPDAATPASAPAATAGAGAGPASALTESALESASDSALESAPESAPESARRAARRRQVRALGPGQLLVCSYALLQIDAAVLGETAWHSVVIDEAQAIKNPATRRAKAALALRAEFKLALTGTPIENRLGELWSIMGFCNPGLLGSAEQFAQRFANPIERGDDANAKAQASRRLRRLLAPFLLRRTKAEVLTDLPPRTEIVHEVVPGPKERALLEALRQQAQASVAEAMSANAWAGAARAGQNQFHVLAALTRLRRAACDPRLVAPELGIVGSKVLEFERLATELVAGRHKALVFSQFTDFLALLRERLDLAGLSYQYLDGSTPAAERMKRVAAFQAGTGDLFLISLKAGGFGLNLTVADYVIIADPWWNPATEEQASARAHRIGQQRPVTVYRLVTQGSIEEKIVRLHRSKRELAEGILSGQDAASAPVDAAQLMDLLRDD